MSGHVYPVEVPSIAITGALSVESLTDDYDLNLRLVHCNVEVNGIPVTAADIEATNGVIHSISASPLLPPCVTENIVDQLVADPEFSTLVSLVQAAGLVEALNGPASAAGLTVLAPTNEAFEDLPSHILDYLANNVDALTEVLTYHVIPQNVVLGGGNEGGSFETLNGESVRISFGDVTALPKSGKVNGVDVTEGDKLASNGVWHEIESVLIPDGLILPDP